ncbi:MAG: hypothetical protein K940chlam7_00693 [Chlamydiae bacterium]|nr:hypothetical protein [Chlamydiota bacterium]
MRGAIRAFRSEEAFFVSSLATKAPLPKKPLRKHSKTKNYETKRPLHIEKRGLLRALQRLRAILKKKTLKNASWSHQKISPITKNQIFNDQPKTNVPRTNDLELPGPRQPAADTVENVVADAEP